MVADRMTVRLANPLEEPNWDRDVAKLPGATFFHSVAWARVLHDSYHFHPAYFVQRADGGQIDSLLPVMEVNSWLTGRRGVSLPFTDECKPLGRSPETLRAITREIISHGARRKWKYWEVRSGLCAEETPPSLTFYGHELALCTDPRQILARCGSAVRRAVRKAEHSPLTVTIAHDVGAIRAFHKLVCKTRKRQGLPPQPLRFFEQIQRNVLAPGHGCVVMARLGNQAVAGSIFFHFAKTVLLKFNASDYTFHSLCPNNIVMWRAIEWYSRCGFEVLDFGRTSLDHKGLRRYKLGWGVTERSIDYTRYDCREGMFVTNRDTSSGWQSNLFKFLPSFVSRVIGAAAYKHVA